MISLSLLDKDSFNILVNAIKGQMKNHKISVVCYTRIIMSIYDYLLLQAVLLQSGCSWMLSTFVTRDGADSRPLQQSSTHARSDTRCRCQPSPGLPVTKLQNDELLWNMRQLDIWVRRRVQDSIVQYTHTVSIATFIIAMKRKQYNQLLIRLVHV